MRKLSTKQLILLAADVLLIPGLFLCEKLSDLMLSQYSECIWLRFGGKCITCGGTHFVNTLLNGRFVEAFHHNEFLFVLTLLLALSLILLHLSWFFDVKFATAALKRIFSIPSLIIVMAAMLVFFFIRIFPSIQLVAHLITQALQNL